MVFDESEFKRQCREEIDEQLNKEMDDIIDDIFFKSQELLDITNKTTDQGFLASNVDILKMHLQKEIRYNASYAACIEFGTRPHFPPVDELKPWVRRKLGVSLKNVDNVARRIAWKIYHYGTDPQPFLTPPINEYVSKGILEYDMSGVGSLGAVIYG